MLFEDINMAIWQFRIDLIPEKAICSRFACVPVSLTRELAEQHQWWAGHQPPPGFENRLTNLLPEVRSWSASMRIWGDERGDTASVCYDSTRNVEWIGFRVDVRHLTVGFVEGICDLAKLLRCMLMTKDYHLLAPEPNEVLLCINRSPARQYLDDPASALRGLKLDPSPVARLPDPKTGEPPLQDSHQKEQGSQRGAGDDCTPPNSERPK
jgi:hypothetical protein